MKSTKVRTWFAAFAAMLTIVGASSAAAEITVDYDDDKLKLLGWANII